MMLLGFTGLAFAGYRVRVDLRSSKYARWTNENGKTAIGSGLPRTEPRRATAAPAKLGPPLGDCLWASLGGKNP